MTSKNDKAAAHAEPARSAARATLKARIDAREAARATIADRQAAARRLALIGETAQALAGQLAGLKAQAAATLAEHALNGTGRPPKLSEDGRDSLAAKLAEAQAQAEAAGPAMVAVEAAITEAFAELSRASAAVAAVTRPVLEQEVSRLVDETRETLDRLRPLIARLAGAKAYAYDLAHSGAEEDRTGFIRLGNHLDAVTAELGLDPRALASGTQDEWAALSQRLTIDPDAVLGA